MACVSCNVKVACRYEHPGGPFFIARKYKEAHEQNCTYRVYDCPCICRCLWKGTHMELIEHFQNKHPHVCLLEGARNKVIIFAVQNNGNGIWVMLQTCFGWNFFLVLQKIHRSADYITFHAYVQIVGSPEEAALFNYRIRLENQKARFTWESATRSSYEDINVLMPGDDCFVFSWSTAESFFKDDGSMVLEITIFEA